ncbi:MAG TPA: MFS transporter [Anaerolineales bacterium]
MAGRLPLRFSRQLVPLILTRTAINTAYRMVYPFLPVIARGLGVAPEAIILGVTARLALGLATPFLGALADRVGRKPAMLAGIVTFMIGGLIVGLYPSYTTLIVALLTVGLSRSLFDPALQAYVGDRVAFERRGTPMALVELSWSGAYLLGVPVVGLLIGAAGWVAPFPALAAVALLGALWVGFTLPGKPGTEVRGTSITSGFSAILARRSALAGLAVGFLLSSGNETVSIVYGLWMEQSFGLQIAALGAATAVIGLAELGGEGLVAGFADRIGKRRLVAAGMIMNTAAALVLPQLGGSLAVGLIGLFAFYLSFEATIVSTLPLMSEQVPEARATLLATNIAGLLLGRSLGALAGAPLFSLGMQANGAAAAALNLLALGLLLGLVKERGS